jgi:hypothetical protein
LGQFVGPVELAKKMEADDSWNKMLTKLEMVDLENQQQENSKKLKKKEDQFQVKKLKKHVQNLSWSMMNKTLTKSIVAA